jgi:hypothetical protein
VYSNAVYSLAGRLMEAMIGVEWAYEGGANAPDGWGPVAEILRAYLAGEGTDVNRAFAFDPVAARRACGANPNASNQPCYRELDPDTGAEIQQYDWIQPWRYRIAQVMPNQLRWQFCQSEVQSECETDNTLWSASPNAAAAYAIDGYYTASGLVWTMPELVRYARGHVMTGGSGDDRGGNFDETSADYQQRSRAFTGASDIDVSLTFGIPRIQGGHGGGLRGTRAGVRRYRSGEDLAPKIEIPRFVRGSPNDVWNLDGPRLGSTAVEAAYVKPWVATPLPPGFVGTPVPPPSCKLTANTDYVWSLNQGNDPSNNSFASSKDGAFTAPSDDNKKNDIDAYTVMGRLIEDAICQCEESTCW